MAKNGGYGYPNSYNETGGGDANTPDVSGKDMYFSYEEVQAMHLSQTGPMDETANSKSGRGVMGGPAPGEPNPAGMGKD